MLDKQEVIKTARSKINIMNPFKNNIKKVYYVSAFVFVSNIILCSVYSQYLFIRVFNSNSRKIFKKVKWLLYTLYIFSFLSLLISIWSMFDYIATKRSYGILLLTVTSRKRKSLHDYEGLHGLYFPGKPPSIFSFV